VLFRLLGFASQVSLPVMKPISIFFFSRSSPPVSSPSTPHYSRPFPPLIVRSVFCSFCSLQTARMFLHLLTTAHLSPACFLFAPLPPRPFDPLQGFPFPLLLSLCSRNLQLSFFRLAKSTSPRSPCFHQFRLFPYPLRPISPVTHVPTVPRSPLSF